MKRLNVLMTISIVLVQHGLTHGIADFPPVTYNSDRVPKPIREKLNNINDEQFHEATRSGVNSVNQDSNLERHIRTKGIDVEENSESYAQMLESMANEKSKKLDQIARNIIKSSSFLVNTHCISENIDSYTCAQFLSTKSLPVNSELHQKCSSIIDRNEYAYTRLLPARYKDGIYQMINAPNLPRPRMIAFDNATEADRSDPENNLLVMQWAQFIEHDLSKPVATTMSNGDPIECCTDDNYMLLPRYVHPACAPLEGNEHRDEYTYVSCQNYVRNAQTSSKCTFGPAVMLNQENGKLDLSQLYGLWPDSQRKMRTFKDGLLKSSRSTSIKNSLLPITNDSTEFCLNPNARDCFMAGDSRVNSNPFTTQLYTIFLRSHNLIARKVKNDHPSFNDDEIFTLARKQNIEDYISIVYNSWLPATLGAESARSIRNHIPLGPEGISSEFGVAAIRFYYSMMPDRVDLDEHCLTGSLDISKQFYNSDFLNNDCALNSLLKGMLKSNVHKADIYYKSIVLQNCLKSREQKNGVDCLAIDVQRGRDHGLAGYSNYLERCTGAQISNWKDLEAYIDGPELQKLKNLYASIADIDLIVGAMSERPANGILGVTNSCILADQFAKIWKQMEPKINLDENKGVIRQLLCHTTGLQTVPRDAFKVPSEKNILINCSSV